MNTNIFHFIKNQIDIIDVVSHYVNLTPIGYYYKGFSPFKGEKTPSFTVTPEKKIFYCFSTNQGGDVIDFISKIEQCSQYEAALFLIEKYQLIIPKTISYDHKKDNETNKNSERYFKIYKKFVTWAQLQLEDHKKAQSFLEKRGISEKSIEQYSLGFCPSGALFQKFVEEMKKDGILHNDFISIGIIQKYFSTPFADRIIFPIQNYIGLFCGCGARNILESNISSKYINSQQSNEFSKKKLLYGFEQAKVEIKKTKSVIIVEGYIDVIMTSQAGFKNVIGTMGTALTKEHIDFLKRFVNNIILIYDGDTAGQNAIKKAIQLLWSELIDTDIVILPENEDPASLSEKNMLEKYINQKINAVDFFIQGKKKSLIEDNSLKNIHNIFCEITEILSQIEDQVKKTTLIFKVSQDLNIHPSLISIFTDQKETKKLTMHTTKKISSEKKNVNFEKELFLLLFYFSIISFEETYCEINEIINILNLNNYEKYVNILIEYKNTKTTKEPFLDYIKEKYYSLYEHIIKTTSKYIFNKKTYEVLYKKIIEISWKEHQKNNVQCSINHFLSLIKQKV